MPARLQLEKEFVGVEPILEEPARTDSVQKLTDILNCWVVIACGFNSHLCLREMMLRMTRKLKGF
jgi:hypothetical protein